MASIDSAVAPASSQRPDSKASPAVPVDRFLYWASVFLGFSLLLPFGVVNTAIPFFVEVFKDESMAFWVTLAFVEPQLPLQPLVLLYGERFSAMSRMQSTIVLQAIMLAALPLLGGASVGATLTLLVLGGLATSLMESSLFGYYSLLPSVYTQAVVFGESLAGLVASASQITAKLIAPDKPGAAAQMYFWTSTFCMLLAAGLQWRIASLPAVRRAMMTQKEAEAQARAEEVAAGAAAGKAGKFQQLEEVEEERGAAEAGAGGGGEGVGVGVGAATISPVLPSDKEQQEQQQVILQEQQLQHPSEAPPSSKKEGEGWWARARRVYRICWRSCLAILLNFVVSFAVYPSVSAEIPYRGDLAPQAYLQQDRAWWTIILFAIYNCTDVLARHLAGKRKAPLPDSRLLHIALLRFLLVPLVVGLSRGWPGLQSDSLAVLALMAVAGSNGLLSSLSMMFGPSNPLLPAGDREFAGFLHVLFLHLGIWTGAQASLLFLHK